MRHLHPREWEAGNAACFGHDDEPGVIDLLAEIAETAQPYGVAAPLSLSELYYPPRVKDLYHVYADRAKDYCHGKDRRHPCPVLKECLLWAIVSDEEHGIWGGMSHRERNALVRKVDSLGREIEDYVMTETGNL